MVSIMVALDRSDRENGCLQILKGSHRSGRLDHVGATDEQNEADPERMAGLLARCETVHCELDPGDAVFFHCNTLHGSGLNATDSERVMIFCSYNAVSNAPHVEARGPNDEGAYMNITAEERAYRPLTKIADDVLVKRRYKSAFSHTRFQEANYELDDTFCQALNIEKS